MQQEYTHDNLRISFSFVTLVGYLNFFSLPTIPNFVVLLSYDYRPIAGEYLVEGGDDFPTKSW